LNEGTKFRGNLSVKKHENERPLLMFGQDKAIFKQFLLTKKSWCGPNGETVLVPKNEGQGLMISAFQSREFGFGFQINKEQLAEVNIVRRGKNIKIKRRQKIQGELTES
jgi:hypothetical protein